MSNNTPEKIHVRFFMHAVMNANGESGDYVGQRINSHFAKAVADMKTTGDSAATVHEVDALTMALSDEAMELDEDIIAAWISHQIEDGHMELERLPLLMARYALTDPGQMREEIAERMRLQKEEESQPTSKTERPS